MKNPYAVLGVAPEATPEEIKTSFRKLAKRYHPDGNPDDPEAASRFQAVQSAYALLKDPDQRLRFDKGLIDADGTPRSQPFPMRRRRAAAAQPAAQAPPPQQPAPAEEDSEDAIFSELFASLRRAKRTPAEPVAAARPSAVAPLALSVSFEDAASGTKAELTLPSGKAIRVAVPAGVEDGQVIRLKAGDGKSATDIRIRICVAPHPSFARAGLDVTSELSVSLPEAVLGAKVRVPTLSGEVVVQIPPGSNTGTVLKLRGRGLSRETGPTGDQLVTLRVVLPETPDAELESFLRDWSRRRAYQVRS